MRAALEAALSAAEPVAEVLDKPGGFVFSIFPEAFHRIHIGDKLYADPPVPSVAVTAFETNKEMLTAFGAEDIREGSRMCFEANGEDTWEGYYEVPFHALDRIRSALSAQVQDVAGWKPIETAPKDKTRIIIAVPTKDRDDWIVGEGYFDPDHYEDGDWWWANLDYSDYHAGPISDCNHWPPELWQPLPVPAAAPAKQEG
ncbi:hypothetical protein [Agrobacterium tumefaciens]|uniref:hypothetical protein n=1 Tax=Agrobacterium tumefaciens TaxID=358 RepID=UPI003B9EE9DD